jgi:nicotinate phosphoribosyltransferase
MNNTLLADFYEITMANGYFKNNMYNEIAYFDMFFRKVPDNAGFAIMAGVEQLIEYFNGLNFDEEDIEFLRQKGIFDEDFLNYLNDFKFECDVWAIPEGTPIFPN